MERKHGLLRMIGNSYNKIRSGCNKIRYYSNKGKLFLIAAATAGAIGLTSWKGVSYYNRLRREGLFERAATVYFIGSGRSINKLLEETSKLKDYISEVNGAKEELEELRRRDLGKLDESIDSLGDSELAKRLRGIRSELVQVDSELRNMYDKERKKLEEMVSASERLGKYSSFWRRAVKVKTFIVYEYLSYARRKIEEEKSKGGIRGKLYGGFEKFGESWLEGVLGKNASDSEKKYLELRERIRAYSQAENAEQGLANLVQHLNSRIKDKDLGEGEKQTYILIRDIISNTGNVRLAEEVLDYIQYGKLPNSLNKEAKRHLESQRELFDIINRSYDLYAKRFRLATEAEELGIELEKGRYERLEEISKRLDAIADGLLESDNMLRQIGVDPRDPEYLAAVRNFKSLYIIGLLILCGLEFSIGYFFYSGASQKRKLQKHWERMA